MQIEMQTESQFPIVCNPLQIEPIPELEKKEEEKGIELAELIEAGWWA